jgi:hypothetical protein
MNSVEGWGNQRGSKTRICDLRGTQIENDMSAFAHALVNRIVPPGTTSVRLTPQ